MSTRERGRDGHNNSLRQTIVLTASFMHMVIKACSLHQALVYISLNTNCYIVYTLILIVLLGTYIVIGGLSRCATACGVANNCNMIISLSSHLSFLSSKVVYAHMLIYLFHIS